MRAERIFVMRGFIKYYIFVFITVLILFNPQSSLEYARSGLSMCAEILVPSLLPFFVCSGLLIYSGFCQQLARLFGPVMRPLFNVGGAGAAAFILGIISGYPLGAATACSLYDGGYLSKTECERLLAFSNNSGPLFILGSVGVAIFHSPKCGMLLYISHIAAAFTVGILFRFYHRNEASAVPVPVYDPQNDIGRIFQKAISSSINSILTVCAAVVFFSVAANIIKDILPQNSGIKTFFLAASELTNGIGAIAASGMSDTARLVLSAAAAGFAGLCVHLQVMGVAAGRGLSLVPYIMGKMLHGLIAAGYMYILLEMFPITAQVFAGGASLYGSFFAASLYTALGALALSVVGAMVIAAMAAQKKRRKNSRA